MKNSDKKHQGPRIVVRSSGIHGRGVFARRRISEDDTVCEYKGEIISEAEAARRYPENMGGLNHTFIFGIEHDRNIDGGANGNIARWINHSCDPNCDTYEENKRMFIRAIRAIRPGEELSYDYNIEAGERITKAVKARWPCWCGAKSPLTTETYPCRQNYALPDRRSHGERVSIRARRIRRAIPAPRPPRPRA